MSTSHVGVTILFVYSARYLHLKRSRLLRNEGAVTLKAMRPGNIGSYLCYLGWRKNVFIFAWDINCSSLLGPIKGECGYKYMKGKHERNFAT